ncbi:MAG: AAA family ATPase [Candidatus Bathyarchaeia archaeon]
MLQNKVLDLEREITARFIANREAIKVLILNQLHPRSASLIRAPRGVGKSTLMLLLLKGITGDDFVVISGASEVKRGEVVGRLHIPSLEKEGVERVLWAAFVKSRGKGIDELNRLNPYTTANIHHLMQFGEVWAYGQKSKVDDYILIANENPSDTTSFIHPPPFYDRFDICIFLRTLTLSEKFQLQEILEKYDWNLVESMPQILSFEDLQEIREEVASTEIDAEIIGYINLLVRDFQSCVRDKENSEIKPPALCEGCHFIREVCSVVKEPVSERATVALINLAKAFKWLYGKCDIDDIFQLSAWVFLHRLSLIRTRNIMVDIYDLLERERAKMENRRIRRQWTLLNEMMKGFNPSLYRLAKEAAVEDVVFAEELMKMEEKWISEGLIKRGEDIATQMGWRTYHYR